MVILAALVLAAAPPAAAPTPRIVAAESQAVAMVRIFRTEPVRFAEIEKTAPESFSDARITGADGSSEPARLIEFH